MFASLVYIHITVNVLVLLIRYNLYMHVQYVLHA